MKLVPLDDVLAIVKYSKNPLESIENLPTITIDEGEEEKK